MKILLIEDNKDIAKNIKEYLELEGYVVVVSHRGDDGLDIATTKTFDLILLDISLPGADGISICRQIRKKSITPIIMVTARESIEDKLDSFDVGATDYIIKPFDLRELSSRIKVRLKNTDDKKIFIWKDIEIDLESRKFLVGEKKLSLTQKEFLILEFLIKRNKSVVTRTDMIEHVWGSDRERGADAKLDVYISNLRSKFYASMIVTIKGVGYKIGDE